MARTIRRWAGHPVRTPRGSAARIGAACGAIIVGRLALVVGTSINSDPFLGGNDAGVVAVTAGGALLGAGVGALVGAAIPKWVNVHVGRTAR